MFGLLERDGDRLFNACALVGPTGYVASYRKIHLPCLGADRFTDPGDRPFAVHDLGGLKVGMNICFDGSFPEAARVPDAARGGPDRAADQLGRPRGQEWRPWCSRARALENHVYYLAVNRVGDEAGFHYIGQSSVADYIGDFLAVRRPRPRGDPVRRRSTPRRPGRSGWSTAPASTRSTGVNWRRPDLYGPLVEPQAEPFVGHCR